MPWRKNVVEATVAGRRGIRFWSVEPEKQAAKRAVGSMLFFLMPERALDDALESLEEAWRFYERRSLPERESLAVTSGTGRVVRSLERPPFALET